MELIFITTRSSAAVLALVLSLLPIVTVNAVIIHDAHTHRATGIYYSREQLAAHALELGAQFPCVGQGIGFNGEVRVRMGSVVKFDHFVVGSLHALNNARNHYELDEVSVAFGENAKEDFLAGKYFVPTHFVEYPEIDRVLYFFEEGVLDHIPSAVPHHEIVDLMTEVVQIGRGDFGHQWDEDVVWDSRLRGVSTLVESYGIKTIGDDHLVTHFRFSINSQSRSFGGRGANGDSGGGMFMQLPDGSWVCVGFNDRIFGEHTEVGQTAALRMSDPRVVALFEEHAPIDHPTPDQFVPRFVSDLRDGELVLNFEQFIGNEAPSLEFRHVVQGFCYTPQISSDLVSWEDVENVTANSELTARPGYQWFSVSLKTSSDFGFIRVLVR